MIIPVPVQQQTKNTDCELFSIAFAYHVATRESYFYQRVMRQQLLYCLYHVETEVDGFFHLFTHTISGEEELHKTHHNPSTSTVAM